MSASHHDRRSPLRRPASATSTPSELELVLRSHDVVDHVRRLTWLLTDGDFEALVLWCELACHDGPAARPPSRAAADGARPLALHELVEATGIPRETARRKLARLAALGRAERRGSGWVAGLAALDPARRALARESAGQLHAALAAARRERLPPP